MDRGRRKGSDVTLPTDGQDVVAHAGGEPGAATWIETVSGPRRAADIGIADAHAHLWIAPRVPGAPALTDPALALAELADFALMGGSLVVDCQPGDCGRDGRVLARLARESPVAVVAATGFHLARYYPAGEGPWALGADASRALFERELRAGLDEAPAVRAGVVKAAWTGDGSGLEQDLMRAALEAAHRADAAVVIHTEAGTAVEGLVRLVEGSGLSPARVQLSHIDKRPDPALHRDLARAGYALGYDTFLRPKYDPERHVWPLLRAMIADGLWPWVTLGLDLVDAASWHVRGGPGLRALSVDVLARLRREGVGDTIARALTGGNVARLLGRAGRVDEERGKEKGGDML